MSSEQYSVSGPPIVSQTGIRVAPLGELSAYIIYEHELDTLDRLDADLAKDPPESLYLNFALSLLPISLSFLIALLTTTIHSNRVYELFVIVAFVTFLFSLPLFALWRRDRRTHLAERRRLLSERADQIQKIKNRMPPRPPAQGTQMFTREQEAEDIDVA